MSTDTTAWWDKFSVVDDDPPIISVLPARSSPRIFIAPVCMLSVSPGRGTPNGDQSFALPTLLLPPPIQILLVMACHPKRFRQHFCEIG